MAMVLRSIYLDPTLDAELAGRAEVEGVTKAELMRRFLVEGLERPAGRFAGYAAAEPRAAYAVEAVRATAPSLAPRSSYAAARAAEPAADWDLEELVAPVAPVPPARVASGSIKSRAAASPARAPGGGALSADRRRATAPAPPAMRGDPGKPRKLR